ncbi:MAG: tRNA adenosine(34) deaminase TadA [Firmicutes bacterium]|nr:tRNA adenosine(34) deaminase TadA [Bacillota bacterium]
MSESERYMAEALEEAAAAASEGEVPIGAVVVHGGEIVSRAHNMTVQTKDPTAHAEMLAMKAALEALKGKNHRLSGCELYVTLEPCAMCAGAIVLNRIDKLYIGTMDPKSGACGSLFDIVRDERLNHRAAVETGVLEAACSGMLKDFFRGLRSTKDHPEEV